MRRHEPKDEQFNKIEHMLPGRKEHVGVTAGIMEAAKRERRLKNWCRKWKLNLIEQFNPTWRDLYDDLCN